MKDFELFLPKIVILIKAIFFLLSYEIERAPAAKNLVIRGCFFVDG